jgi:hypothetical protein
VWDARKGAVELYDSFTSIGLKVDDFEGVRYKRIAHIKSLIADGLLDESLRWKTVPAQTSAVAAEVGVA